MFIPFDIPRLPIIVFLALYFLAILSFFVLWREGLIRSVGSFLFASMAIILAFFIRTLCMNHQSLDYINFLSRWVMHFRNNGGFSALSGSVGNYNLPYLYFLALFSYIDRYDLYLIKLLSIFFDVVLAFASMKLLSKLTDSINARLSIFIGVLLLPTVILNGAFWGQCDSIYTAFGVLSIWFALDNKPVKAVVCIASAFAFKLQAIFIMPIFSIFFLMGKIKLRHCFAFPLTYIVLALPAVFFGRPFLETLTLYIDQAGTVGSGLNYNSPSIFALLPYGVDFAFLSPLGVILAFAVMSAILFFVFQKREVVDDKTLVTATFLLSVVIPFLLPHMHDRYFFAADIFSIIFAMSFQEYFTLPILCSFASLLGYHAYIRQAYLMPMSVGSICLLIVIFILLAELNYHIQNLDDSDLSIA